MDVVLSVSLPGDKHKEAPHQEGGARDGKGLLVEVGAGEEQQQVPRVLLLVVLQELSHLPQILQVRGELQPVKTGRPLYSVHVY